ncbi:Vmc-like lipoprotein signal peptide domain-containing protein [Mycoplasmopsis agassizii]|nr:hypothetical protein [Mycoplasmopsis agassizii]
MKKKHKKILLLSSLGLGFLASTAVAVACSEQPQPDHNDQKALEQIQKGVNELKDLDLFSSYPTQTDAINAIKALKADDHLKTNLLALFAKKSSTTLNNILGTHTKLTALTVTKGDADDKVNIKITIKYGELKKTADATLKNVKFTVGAPASADVMQIRSWYEANRNLQVIAAKSSQLASKALATFKETDLLHTLTAVPVGLTKSFTAVANSADDAKGTLEVKLVLSKGSDFYKEDGSKTTTQSEAGMKATVSGFVKDLSKSLQQELDKLAAKVISKLDATNLEKIADYVNKDHKTKTSTLSDFINALAALTNTSLSADLVNNLVLKPGTQASSTLSVTNNKLVTKLDLKLQTKQGVDLNFTKDIEVAEFAPLFFEDHDSNKVYEPLVVNKDVPANKSHKYAEIHVAGFETYDKFKTLIDTAIAVTDGDSNKLTSFANYYANFIKKRFSTGLDEKELFIIYPYDSSTLPTTVTPHGNTDNKFGAIGSNSTTRVIGGWQNFRKLTYSAEATGWPWKNAGDGTGQDSYLVLDQYKYYFMDVHSKFLETVNARKAWTNSPEVTDTQRNLFNSGLAAAIRFMIEAARTSDNMHEFKK